MLNMSSAAPCKGPCGRTGLSCGGTGHRAHWGPVWATREALNTGLTSRSLTSRARQAVADEIRRDPASSGVVVELVPCDLARAAGVAKLCAAAERHAVTLAVLNAGMCESGALCEQSAARAPMCRSTAALSPCISL